MNMIEKFFEGKKLMVITVDDEPKFLLKDVCEILGLAQVASVKRRLSDDVLSTHPISDSLGRKQEAVFVNEDGLYDVVLDSKKKSAKKFRKWVTSDVVPSIRKNGAYMTPDTIEQVLSDPDTIIKIATNLKEEQQKRKEAEKQLEDNKPQYLFSQAVTVSQSCCTVNEMAKILKQNGIDTGEKRFYIWLREKGYLIKSGHSYNLPTQKSMDLGLFKVEKGTYTKPTGDVIVTRTTKVTGKGQIYFVNKHLNK